MSSLTSHLPFLSQYLNLSRGLIAVPVTELVTGRFLSTGDVLLELFTKYCPLGTTVLLEENLIITRGYRVNNLRAFCKVPIVS